MHQRLYFQGSHYLGAVPGHEGPEQNPRRADSRGAAEREESPLPPPSHCSALPPNGEEELLPRCGGPRQEGVGGARPLGLARGARHCCQNLLEHHADGPAKGFPRSDGRRSVTRSYRS